MTQNVMTQEPVLSVNATRTLEARYLIKGPDGRAVETPADLFRRVANFVAQAERHYGAADADVQRWAREFYRAMIQTQFLPNSPTLMNAGRPLGVLSACFVLPVEDSVEGIFESVKQTAQIQKAGGGTGFSFDRLRPTGDWIASSGGQSSGPMSFWRVFSEATRAIQQGAFRRGANMGMMSLTHPDILKFITAKRTLREFENFNISVKVTDEFLAALRDRPLSPHVVTNPRDGRPYYLPRGLDIRQYTLADLVAVGDHTEQLLYTVEDVWGLVVDNAHATGEPGACFIDRVNDSNPTPQLGRIEATNPCGEQPLLEFEACNLGSIDLAKLCRGGALDEQAFRELIRLGVRFLDDVIDVAAYVAPAIESRCKGNRKIGLGVMGLADAMFELNIKYDSDEGLAFGDRVASILAQESAAAGEELARQRGSFPNWRGSVWDTRHNRPMRNAALTTIAPTGTLSILAGCSGGIEPVYALAFYRHILNGQQLLEASAPFKRYAQARGFWSAELEMNLAGGMHLSKVPGVDTKTRDLFVTAHDVAPAMHVRMQAVFQRHLDGAISKTINLPQSATVADVDAVYRQAHELGCKGVTVYRDNCRAGQPMTTTPLSPTPGLCPRCRNPLEDESGCTRCPTCGSVLCQ